MIPSFSMDWIFAVLTLGCFIFIFQILMDYSKQASSIRPQLKAVDQIQERHTEEMEKVEKLIKTAEEEGVKLDKRLAEVEGKHDELEASLKALKQKREGQE